MDNKGTSLMNESESESGVFSRISLIGCNISADIPLVSDSQLREILSSICEELASEDKYPVIGMTRSYESDSEEEYLFRQSDGKIMVDYDILTEIYPYLDQDNMRRKLIEEIRNMIGS